jgi:hypothetical protein
MYVGLIGSGIIASNARRIEVYTLDQGVPLLNLAKSSVPDQQFVYRTTVEGHAIEDGHFLHHIPIENVLGVRLKVRDNSSKFLCGPPNQWNSYATEFN